MRRRRNKPSQPRVGAAEVGEFIAFVRSRLAQGHGHGDSGLWLSRADEGSLFLDPEEKDAYATLMGRLLRDYATQEDLSRKTVETLLHDAIFDALDLPGRRADRDFDARLEAAAHQLIARLNAAPGAFTCWVPVEGLTLDAGRARFADIRFVMFGSHQRRQLNALRSNPGHPTWKTFAKGLREEDLWGRPCSVVRVRARDSGGAEALALRRTQDAIDAINLFSDLVSYNHGWLYLAGHADRGRRIVVVQKEDGHTSVPHTNLPPFGGFSWRQFRSETRLRRPFQLLSGLAEASEEGSCGAVLVAAAQWAGRATVDRRREQAFLLYAIALETLLLPGSETGELSYRLRVRAAALLGRTAEQRAEILDDMKRLYGLRSAVVHAGSYDVRDADLGLMRSIVKIALFKLLRLPSLHSLKAEELGAWLDRRQLR